VNTELLTESEQQALDAAHDACNGEIERLSSEYKIACQRAARNRDRVEVRVFERVAVRLRVPVASIQPLRDSQGIPLGVTFVDQPPVKAESPAEA